MDGQDRQDNINHDNHVNHVKKKYFLLRNRFADIYLNIAGDSGFTAIFV